jgi:hypothetical protein
MAYRVAIETYIYFHTQCAGYQVRKVKSQNGRQVYDVSKFFSVAKCGSLRKAASEARIWKGQNLRRW